MSIARNILIGGGTIAVCAAGLLVAQTLATPAAAVETDLPTLEKAFEENPATAMANYAGKPLRIAAVVEKIDMSSVELKTIYMLQVTAKVPGGPVGVVAGPATLLCSGIREVSIGGGYKPELLNCIVESQP